MAHAVRRLGRTAAFVSRRDGGRSTAINDLVARRRRLEAERLARHEHHGKDLLRPDIVGAERAVEGVGIRLDQQFTKLSHLMSPFSVTVFRPSLVTGSRHWP